MKTLAAGGGRPIRTSGPSRPASHQDQRGRVFRPAAHPVRSLRPERERARVVSHRRRSRPHWFVGDFAGARDGEVGGDDCLLAPASGPVRAVDPPADAAVGDPVLGARPPFHPVPMVLKSSVPASPKSMVPSSVNEPSSSICTLDVNVARCEAASSMERVGPARAERGRETVRGGTRLGPELVLRTLFRPGGPLELHRVADLTHLFLSRLRHGPCSCGRSDCRRIIRTSSRPRHGRSRGRRTITANVAPRGRFRYLSRLCGWNAAGPAWTEAAWRKRFLTPPAFRR